ncbi:hypothetical protein [Brachybacterium hainanense]|uniref:Uncharacterized protein n=1 Tax=Brachybacterium hainanense TaxID=1541174 RepID=A0ABV6RAP0_9MICO
MTDADLASTLEDLLDSGAELTRRLLGPQDDGDPDGTDQEPDGCPTPEDEGRGWLAWAPGSDEV